jgi:hypothetical protein
MVRFSLFFSLAAAVGLGGCDPRTMVNATVTVDASTPSHPDASPPRDALGDGRSLRDVSTAHDAPVLDAPEVGDAATARDGSVDACGQPLGGPPGVLLFGGWSYDFFSNEGGSGSVADDLGDTWIFDPGTWGETACGGPSPSARFGASMASLEGSPVLFGGGSFDSNASLGDTWIFDGTGMTWAELNLTSAPSPRSNASMAALGNLLVLFGGGTLGPDAALGDTWTFDGTTWSQVMVPSGPPARGGAAMGTLAGDPVALVVLFGGTGGGGAVLNDTWTFDGTTWREVTVASPPPPRCTASMATLGETVVLFGGNACEDVIGGGAVLDDTWTFDGTTWTEVNAPNPPAGREGASMVTLGSKVLLFGGEALQEDLAATPPPFNDTWTFDGTAWTQLSPSLSPPGRFYAAMGSLQGPTKR